MGEPNYSINWSAQRHGAIAVSRGCLLVPADDDTDTYLVATDANCAGRRAEAISLNSIGASERGSIGIQQAGTIGASLSGLDPGSASWCRRSSTGSIERCTPATGDDIIGYADPDGRVHLTFGVLTAEILYGSETADDIDRSDGTTIDRVRGFNGTALETTDTPSEDESWVFDGTKYRADQPPPRNWYDVKSKRFGAVGDGSTDDTAAINAAIAAANLNGGTVYLPAGSYKVTAALTELAKGVTLLGTWRFAVGTPENGTRILSYVSTGLSLLSLGGQSGGLRNNGVRHISFEQRVDTAADYKTASVFDFTKFCELGFACIEMGAISNSYIDQCAFHCFPIAIILDGAEIVEAKNIIITGGTYSLAGGPGYSEYDEHGVGIWLTRGPSRNNGNLYTQITNANALRNVNCYGGRYGIWAEDGVQNVIENSNFHVGGTPGDPGVAIVIGSCTGLTISNPYFEGSGYSPALWRKDLVSSNVAIGVTLINCPIAGIYVSLNCDDVMYQLSAIGCIFGGPVSGYAMTGMAHVVGFSFQSCTFTAGLGPSDHPGDADGTGISHFVGVGSYGVALNKIAVAAAALDVRHKNVAYPVVRYDYAGVDMYRQWIISAQKTLTEWVSVNPNSGGEGGAKRIVDMQHFGIAGSAVNLAAFAMPNLAHVVFDVKVWQRQAADPTKYQYVHKMQRAYKNGGAITFIGTFDDVAAAGPDQTVSTDVNFTTPTLIDDGAGNVVVHTFSHATAFSQAQVVVDITVARG